VSLDTAKIDIDPSQAFSDSPLKHRRMRSSRIADAASNQHSQCTRFIACFQCDERYAALDERR